ncbi:MAG: IS1380 family transposase [Deltaproteobacteria bacterium]|nr:IS1380 family transposase [Deltaproteobacteria bacterium]
MAYVDRVCIQKTFEFQGLDRRAVVAEFRGGDITSDAGALLLREQEQASGVIRRFAACFEDYRDSRWTEHSVPELVAQRIYGLVLGYEDLNDHDTLRSDPLLATLVGKVDPSGESRRLERDFGKPLAGKSTLNRLELTPEDGPLGHKKIRLRAEAVDRFFVDTFVEAHEEPPKRIVLDVDATDDPLHGDQEGKFFHGYYREYCYLPLYIFCGHWLLCARLRESNIDASKGTVEELERIVEQIRESWPEVEIIVRGDSGFCRDAIMNWCEDNSVKYLFGLAKNERLKAAITEELEEAKTLFVETEEPSRVFKDFMYSTLKSWRCERRVVGKAEHLRRGSNPRFVVTNISEDDTPARELYESLYCARGDMENRIKEQQLCLFADRTSTHQLWSNQIRLWLSSVAYTLLQHLREFGLKGTALEVAQCDTIRLKLLKIGALVRVTVRRVLILRSSSYPYAALFQQVLANIRARAPCPSC